MLLHEKILDRASLLAWRAQLRRQQKRLVVTNGCFDILHAGHVSYLEAARQMGDALLVGLNSDDSVFQLKGAGRPWNTTNDRALVLAALQSVDAVSVFEEKSAASFLGVVQPDVYVKGGDYTLETLDSTERKVVEGAGGKVAILQLIPGKSTSEMIKQIASR